MAGDQLWMTGNQTEPPNLGATEELESLSRQQCTDKSSDNENCDIPSLDSFRLASEAYAAKKTELNAPESKSESIDLNAGILYMLILGSQLDLKLKFRV